MTSTLGKYTLGRTLGSGVSCKVKIGKSKTGQKVAVKILKGDDHFKELVGTEVDVLRKLNHPNIINFIEMGSDLVRKENKSQKVDYIVLELAQGGEMFDFVANSGKF
jgi:serine/threonine protein kinase